MTLYETALAMSDTTFWAIAFLVFWFIATVLSRHIRGLGGPIPMRHDRTINYKVVIYWWSDDLHLVRPPRMEAEVIGKCAFANASNN